MLAGTVAAIFMYHHVSPVVAKGPYARALTVSPSEFDAQLRLLNNIGCAMVGLGRLVTDVKDGRVRGCEVALTFDDGYDDAATQAEPMLRAAGAVGTFFVSTGFIGSSGHLSARQIDMLAADGMEIGAHTISHVDLTKVSAATAAGEIDGSRMKLRGLTGEPITAFAYPAGKSDAAVESVVSAAGFAYAVTTEAGVVTQAKIARDPFALPRYRVEHGT